VDAEALRNETRLRNILRDELAQHVRFASPGSAIKENQLNVWGRSFFGSPIEILTNAGRINTGGGAQLLRVLLKVSGKIPSTITFGGTKLPLYHLNVNAYRWNSDRRSVRDNWRPVEAESPRGKSGGILSKAREKVVDLRSCTRNVHSVSDLILRYYARIESEHGTRSDSSSRASVVTETRKPKVHVKVLPSVDDNSGNRRPARRSDQSEGRRILGSAAMLPVGAINGSADVKESHDASEILLRHRTIHERSAIDRV